MGSSPQRKPHRATRTRASRRKPTPAKIPAADGLPQALRQMRGKLELIQSSAIVVAHALKQQHCELDGDADRVLTRHVSDALVEQIACLDALLAETNA